MSSCSHSSNNHKIYNKSQSKNQMIDTSGNQTHKSSSQIDTIPKNLNYFVSKNIFLRLIGYRDLKPVFTASNHKIYALESPDNFKFLKNIPTSFYPRYCSDKAIIFVSDKSLRVDYINGDIKEFEIPERAFCVGAREDLSLIVFNSFNGSVFMINVLNENIDKLNTNIKSLKVLDNKIYFKHKNSRELFVTEFEAELKPRLLLKDLSGDPWLVFNKSEVKVVGILSNQARENGIGIYDVRTKSTKMTKIGQDYGTLSYYSYISNKVVFYGKGWNDTIQIPAGVDHLNGGKLVRDN